MITDTLNPDDVMDRWAHLFKAKPLAHFTSDAARAAALTDPSNPLGPFHDYVGNEKAVRRLCRAAAASHSHPDTTIRIALLGPASTGKTSLAKKLAKAMSRPFAAILPKSIK